MSSAAAEVAASRCMVLPGSPFHDATCSVLPSLRVTNIVYVGGGWSW